MRSVNLARQLMRDHTEAAAKVLINGLHHGMAATEEIPEPDPCGYDKCNCALIRQSAAKEILSRGGVPISTTIEYDPETMAPALVIRWQEPKEKPTGNGTNRIKGNGSA